MAPWSAELTIVEFLQQNETTPLDRGLLYLLCHPHTAEEQHRSFRAAIEQIRFTRSCVQNVRALVIDRVIGSLPNNRPGFAAELFAACGRHHLFCEHMLVTPPVSFWRPEDPFVAMIEHAPPEILASRPLMSKACQINAATLRHVSYELKMDRDLIAQVLRVNFQSLVHVSKEAQRRHPDLVRMAVELFSSSYYETEDVITTLAALQSFADLIAPKYFQNRENVVHWTKEARLMWPPLDALTGSWHDDHEIILNIAKHCKILTHQLTAFAFAAPSLMGDKSFMLQAVEYCGLLVTYSTGNLWKDFDIALILFAQSRSNIAWYREISWPRITGCTCAERRVFVLQFQKKVAEMIDQHNYFCKTFLPALSPGSGSPAANLGAEHLRCLAEFLGVPTGKQLRLLRQAHDNLFNHRTGYIEGSEDSCWAPARLR